MTIILSRWLHSIANTTCMHLLHCIWCSCHEFKTTVVGNVIRIGWLCAYSPNSVDSFFCHTLTFDDTIYTKMKKHHSSLVLDQILNSKLQRKVAVDSFFTEGIRRKKKSSIQDTDAYPHHQFYIQTHTCPNSVNRKVGRKMLSIFFLIESELDVQKPCTN